MEDVPILYINLDRSKERKIRMEEQFKRYNIKNYKRVPAFDGRKLFSDSSLRSKTVELPKDMKQSSGEIGCSLSHLRAAEMALEIDAPYVLVMEDDIHLTFYERRASPRFTKVPSTRLHERRRWVVSFSNLSCFGPRRWRRHETTWSHESRRGHQDATPRAGGRRPSTRSSRRRPRTGKFYN